MKRRALSGRVRRMDDRGSMAILMMVMLIGLMLSGLLVPMIVTQDRTTRFDSTRVQALNAAEAGIEVTLGIIRASVTDAIGDSKKLPCGTQTGPVSSSGPAAYSTVIEYFTFDPAKALYPKSTPAEPEPYPSPNAMRCIAGYGTFDPAKGTPTPTFARLTSTGTVGAPTNGSTAGRTLTFTYAFRTSDLSLLGGIVQVSPSSAGTPALCMDAGSATPPAATAVRLQACSATTPAAAQQVFTYRTDLTLQLVSSVTAANQNGLCLNSAHTPAVNADALVLSQCGPAGQPAAYTQQWSYNASGQYQAAQASSASTGDLPNLCMDVATQAAAQPITLASCTGADAWILSASSGPGASASNQFAAHAMQWVNYSDAGRCVDVTSEDPNHSYLISYPCKQNPYPGAVTWNQLFQGPTIPAGQASATGQITTNNGQQYCLTSPGSIGGYVTVKTCVTGNPLQNWTVNGGDASLNYSMKYTVVNGSLCLGLGPPNAELPAYLTIDAETCDGSMDQKWNAVANLLNTTLRNVRER